MSNFTIEDSADFPQMNYVHKYLIGTNAYISGGCFKNIFKGEKLKDIDLFFRSEEDFQKGLKEFNSTDDYKFIYRNKNAVGFIDTTRDNLQIDLVQSSFKEPVDMIESFDFTITKFTFYMELNDDDEWESKVGYHKDYFKHLMLNRLVVDSEMQFPLGTFERMIRYIGYGYKPCKMTKEKMVRTINGMDLPSGSDDLFKSLYDGVD